MMVLLALLTTFAGVALIVDRPKGAVLEWLGIPILALGVALFTWTVWPSVAGTPATSTSIASRLLARFTLNGRLLPFFPVIGAAIVVADLGYNLTLSATPTIQTEDTIVLLAAAALFGYNFVPIRWVREAEFVLLFFFWLNVILVVPLLVARAYYADFQRSVDLYSWIALAPQTSATLSLLGVTNSVHSVTGSTAPGLTFTPQHIPGQVTVVITTACSGIYSFGIFASAFVAFVLAENERMSRRVWLLLGVGFLATYLANVLRMTAIVLVGYYTDTRETDLQNMLVAHSYAGWLIFLGWIALFWAISFQWIGNHPTEAPIAARKRGATCAVCNGTLTPVLSSLRCDCGKVYHFPCATRVVTCPNCHHPIKVPQMSGGSFTPP
jgi:archaeosortase C (PEF-CTERM variant)